MSENKKSPQKWAIQISKLLKQVELTHGMPQIPVDVATIAKEFSKQVYPGEPITLIQGESFSRNFDGALKPHPHNGEWGIFYNSAILHEGRINFTLAHEFGHYLLHRSMLPGGLECGHESMLDWQSGDSEREIQANIFASYLLMPLDDFRKQAYRKEINLELIRTLANRYRVSMTAIILKWLSYTKKRAMIVACKEGFIDWARSSKSLMKSGIFYRARQNIVELPEKSLAASEAKTREIMHPDGIWLGNENVYEIIIHSAKDKTSLSLLLYPDEETADLQEDPYLDEILF